MASYPTLASGRTFLAPLVRTTRYGVRIQPFADGSEQRWRTGPPLERFAMRHEGITTADRDALVAFFEAHKGDYAEFDMTMNGTSYTHLKLEAATITTTQGVGHLWDVSLAISQWRKA
ncbi:MAG: hypothetical protein ABFD89_14960 [Bryobacteraceae bacterium]